MTELSSESGTLEFIPRTFGESVNGVPLHVFEPLKDSSRILLISAMHGDENLGSVLLSECMRSIGVDKLRAAMILSMNPDGILSGTRGNARGVDLNRNYPTKNWQADPVFYRSCPGKPQNISLSPGNTPGSEPETQALMELVEELRPELIVSFHGFLACIDDPLELEISQDIAKRSQLRLVPDVGYQTPGSFGTWCAEQSIPIITYELPSMGVDELREKHGPIILDLLTGKYAALLA